MAGDDHHSRARPCIPVIRFGVPIFELLRMTADCTVESRANTTKLSREIVPFCNDSRIKEEENALEAAVHVSETGNISSDEVRLDD
jgi:hypothetical protein